MATKKGGKKSGGTTKARKKSGKKSAKTTKSKAAKKR